MLVLFFILCGGFAFCDVFPRSAECTERVAIVSFRVLFTHLVIHSTTTFKRHHVICACEYFPVFMSAPKQESL